MLSKKKILLFYRTFLIFLWLRETILPVPPIHPCIILCIIAAQTE
ncbi:hypothetical protein HMPREF1985_00689 [Mitsuokella sp. oral taxon 131 str. W9106]|nr:hypothetical protein HMPREF1985_00689 [Mitsuokella sp. oral taxon 131 str. W9106]